MARTRTKRAMLQAAYGGERLSLVRSCLADTWKPSGGMVGGGRISTMWNDHHFGGSVDAVDIEWPSAVVTEVRVEPRDDLRTRFDALVAEWATDTLISSSTTEICSHWAYQRIIGLGPLVVPLILELVASGQRHWGWALAALTGENPAEDTTSPKQAALAWIRWGETHGYLDGQRSLLD